MQDCHRMYRKEPLYVLLDRDGVINRRIPGGYVTSWERFAFLPRALEGLRMFAEHDYRPIVISDQASVGKGLMSTGGLGVITNRFRLEVALTGGNIAAVYYCTHKEEEGCDCRKPRLGLLFRAQVEHGFNPATTYFVSESEAWLEAAEKAGCPAIQIRSDAFLHEHSSNGGSRIIASNLLEAAELVVALQRGRTAEHAMAGAS